MINNVKTRGSVKKKRVYEPCLPKSANQEWPRQTKPKKGQFMNFSQGHSGTKVQCESCLFSQGKAPEFTKKGEIHELFVLALSLVWFARATPDSISLKGPVLELPEKTHTQNIKTHQKDGLYRHDFMSAH